MQNQPSVRWVDRLHERLAVRYGAAWLRMWDGVPIEAVKADWQNELGDIFARNPHAIAHALEHLPEFPPNVEKFKALCMSARSRELALEAPTAKADPERLHKAMAALTAARPPHESPAAVCAAKLRRKVADGFRLTPSQRHVLECCERQIGGMMPATEEA